MKKKFISAMMSVIFAATVFTIPSSTVFGTEIQAPNTEVQSESSISDDIIITDTTSAPAQMSESTDSSSDPSTGDSNNDESSDSVKNIADARITISSSSYYYSNSPIKPVVSVTYRGESVNKKDYTVSYKNNVNPGKATITIKGQNNFTGVKTKSFNIYISKVTGLKTKEVGQTYMKLSWTAKKNISGYKVYKYNFTTKKWEMVKKLKGIYNNSCVIKDLKPGYGYNYKVRAYVTKSSTYHGLFSSILSVASKPGKVTIRSLTPDPRLCITARWYKKTCSGYQVRISRSSSFKNSTVLTVKSPSALARKISNLSDNITYYVQVRAYRTYEGRTTYGDWSSSKKAKTYNTGWLTLNGKKYYYKNAKSLKGSQTVNGRRYYFSPTSGVLLGATKTMWGKVKDQTSGSDWLIAVSRDTHVVCVYNGSKNNWTLKKYWRCSTGAPGTQTPVGIFQVPVERPHLYKFGASKGYTCWYATRFYGNCYFHSVLYEPHSQITIQDGRLGLNISHGCIRMAKNSAKWIYDNIPTKTRVIVY